MNTSLAITLGVLAAEVALFIFCRIMMKRPVRPGRVRLVPYGVIMIFLTLAIFVTVAHTISIMTGEQVMPKRGKIR